MRSKFKDDHPFEKRKAEAERIRQKYSDRIPVRILLSYTLSSVALHRQGPKGGWRDVVTAQGVPGRCLRPLPRLSHRQLRQQD
jgi:hypothetical protein